VFSCEAERFVALTRTSWQSKTKEKARAEPKRTGMVSPRCKQQVATIENMMPTVCFCVQRVGISGVLRSRDDRGGRVNCLCPALLVLLNLHPEHPKGFKTLATTGPDNRKGE
jgi:hypothetical protein